MGIRAAIRDPQRWLLFALALLIHAGLFELLASQRHPITASAEPLTRLVLIERPDERRRARSEVAPVAPPQLQASPPQITAPRLIVPPEDDDARAPPTVDWRRDAEDAARKHAIEAEAARNPDETRPPKPKPEFRWLQSRTQRVVPLAQGGVLIRLSENCSILINVMATPTCKLGKTPVRGDLFEHMDDPPTPGDWKER